MNKYFVVGYTLLKAAGLSSNRLETCDYRLAFSNFQLVFHFPEFGISISSEEFTISNWFFTFPSSEFRFPPKNTRFPIGFQLFRVRNFDFFRRTHDFQLVFHFLQFGIRLLLVTFPSTHRELNIIKVFVLLPPSVFHLPSLPQIHHLHTGEFLRLESKEVIG